MFNKLDIVTRIDELLKKQKIPASKFAIDMGGKENGYSKDTVYTWKTNRSTSYINDLQGIADYLNVTTDYLLGLSDNPNPATLTVPAELQGLSVAFNRGEFEDLTQEEVDALAVIAKTLKSQRKL